MDNLAKAFLERFAVEAGSPHSYGNWEGAEALDQRAFDDLVRAAVPAGIHRAAPDLRDPTGLAETIAAHCSVFYGSFADAAAGPVSMVRAWLSATPGDGSGLGAAGVDLTRLADAITAEIADRLIERIRSSRQLTRSAQAQLEQTTRYLRNLNVMVDALADRARTSQQMPGRPYMVPPRLSTVISRPELHDKVVEALLRGRFDGVAISTALKGAGGFGKTTLAEEICRDPRLVREFPGGILWATMGPDRGASHIAASLNALSAELSEIRPVLLDPGQAGSHFRRQLDARPTLVVVDDVWTSLQSDAFRYGTSSTARLFTTRVASSVPAGAGQIPVDAMEDDEARQLLTLGLPAADPDTVNTLLAMTGGWPVLLSLVNGQAGRLVGMGNSTEEAFRTISDQIGALGSPALDLAHASRRSDAVAATVDVSLSFLAEQSPNSLLMYLKTAVFKPGYSMRLSLLAEFWRVSPGEAMQFCMTLHDLSLVEQFRLDSQEIKLHDVVHSYLRSKVGDVQLQKWSRDLVAIFDRTGREVR